MKTRFLTASIVVAAVLLAPSESSAQSQQVKDHIAQRLAGVMPNQGPAWVKLTKDGLKLQRDGKLEEAANVFGDAYQGMKRQEVESPQSMGFFSIVKVDLLMAYGNVLNRLNRPSEALPVLQQADAIVADERRVRAERGGASMSYLDAMSALSASLSTAQNMARNLQRTAMVYESTDGSTLEKSFDEQFPDTKEISIFLADSYSRLGDKNAVLKLFDSDFQGYLKRQRENDNPDTRFNLDLAIEASCIRFALMLSRVGPSQQREQAFDCALDANLRNQITIGTSATVPTHLESAAAGRRLIVGAYISQHLAESSSDAQSVRKIVALIADSKGLGTRYYQRVNQLLYQSANNRLAQLSTKFAELEKTAKELPNHGNEAVKARVEWENARAELMRQALPELKAEGLADIFVDGKKILKETQNALKDEVLIGYSIYKPIDLKTLAPLSERVLRYAVSANFVGVQDIGSSKEIENLIFKWRSTVAAGGAVDGKELSNRLLNDLPQTFYSTKKWVIDPDGAIALVPFETMSEPGNAMVITNHSIRYVSSISTFARKPETPIKASQTAVVIANPNFHTSSSLQPTDAFVRSNVSTNGVEASSLRFEALPETKVEAVAVSDSLHKLGMKVTNIAGDDATLDAMGFKTAPRYLHVATHGIYVTPTTGATTNNFIRFSTVFPGLESALVFTPSSKGTFFYGSDFARTPLKGTELVVLSACDTGNGDVNVGEGVQSLRSAIEAAGAQASLTSLWAVPSGATTELMRTFYERLASGLSKSDALREAKLELMKTRPKFNQWSGFVLTEQP